MGMLPSHHHQSVPKSRPSVSPLFNTGIAQILVVTKVNIFPSICNSTLFNSNCSFYQLDWILGCLCNFGKNLMTLSLFTRGLLSPNIKHDCELGYVHILSSFKEENMFFGLGRKCFCLNRFIKKKKEEQKRINFSTFIRYVGVWIWKIWRKHFSLILF